MALNPFIRQFDFVVDSPPAEDGAIEVFAGYLLGQVRSTFAFPGGAGEFVSVDNGKIIEGSEGVVDGWIFLVYQELLFMLENELILIARLQIQLNLAKSSDRYFSCLFFKGL